MARLGARSYHDFALGLALLLIAAAIVGTAGSPAHCVPDRALRPHLPSAGVGGWLRRLLGNAHDPDPGGLGPNPCLDDLAGCGRLAHARFGREPPALGGTPLGSRCVPLRCPARSLPSPRQPGRESQFPGLDATCHLPQSSAGLARNASLASVRVWALPGLLAIVTYGLVDRHRFAYPL